MDDNLLIIGKIPPPIGGVTIHVKRLIHFLERDNVSFEFLELNVLNLPSIFRKLFVYRKVFLHTSNSKIRFLLSLVSKLSPSKFIFTFHGNLGRFGKVRNFIDNQAIRLADVPILININSYQEGVKLNKQCKLIPAFIPPINIESLPVEIQGQLSSFIEGDDIKIFCTNAFNISMDKNGEEIYGGSNLIHIFSSLQKEKLIFSDPSGNYKKYLLQKGSEIPENVLMLTQPHDFINIIKISDAFIRATLTDGDSLSVKEALFFDIRVICSDCVTRPDGVVLYKTKNNKDLKDKILNLQPQSKKSTKIINGYDLLKEILIS